MILGTLRWVIRQIGLSDGRILDPAFNGRMAEVQRPLRLPEGQTRLHHPRTRRRHYRHSLP